MPQPLPVAQRGPRSFAATCPVCAYEFIATTAAAVRDDVRAHAAECSDPDGAWREYEVDDK